MMSFSWATIELIGLYFVILLIILLTIGGNLVVLFAFYNDPHLLTPSNHFLLSMAIADLLVGLIGMPFYSFAQIKKFWPFGEFFCKIWLTIDDVATMASVLSIVAITIERYWSINQNVHYRRHATKTRIRIFSILIWLIPFLNFAPGIWLLQPHEHIQTTNITKTNNPECMGAYHSYTIYLIIAQINFFAWPLVVIIVLNVLIILSLYRRSQRFPGYDSLHNKQNDNSMRKIEDRKTVEEQQQHDKIVENDEPTTSIVRGNSYDMLKRVDLEGNNDDHYGNIPPPIQEVDESLAEDDAIDFKPLQSIPSPLSMEIDTKQSSPSDLLISIKKVFFTTSTSNDHRSSKLTQSFHVKQEQTRQKRRSILLWRNTSFRLSTKTASTNSGEQRTVRRLRRDKRAATSLLTLVLVFMIFLLPYVVVVVVGSIFPIEIFTDTNGQLYSAVFWLLWLNSTVNPILYPFIQPKFRDAYRRIFLRLTRRQLTSLIIDIHRNK